MTDARRETACNDARWARHAEATRRDSSDRNDERSDDSWRTSACSDERCARAAAAANSDDDEFDADNSFFGFCNDAPLPSPSDDPAAQGVAAARVENEIADLSSEIADLSSAIADLQKRISNETQPCYRRTLRRDLKTLRYAHSLAVQQYDNATGNIFAR